MSQSLRPFQLDTVDAILGGDGSAVVLFAPSGLGATTMLVGLCKEVFAGGVNSPALVVVPQRTVVDQIVSELKAAGVDAVAVTGTSFRYALDARRILNNQVLVVTQGLLGRKDFREFLSSTEWSLLISEEHVGPPSRTSDVLSTLRWTRGRLIIDRRAAARRGQYPESFRQVDWYLLSRESLGLFPERQALVWPYSRRESELATLGRLAAILGPEPPGRSDAWAWNQRRIAAISSPLAFEEMLMRALSPAGSQSPDPTSDLQEDLSPRANWRPRQEDVESLILSLDASPIDSKLEAFMERANDYLIAGARVVVFSRLVATASYLHEALGDWAAVLGARVAVLHGGMPVIERDRAVSAWMESGPSILIATVGISKGLDLGMADLAVGYDFGASSIACDIAWGRIDRVGRTTKPTLVTLVPVDDSRMSLDAGLEQPHELPIGD